MTDLLLTSGDFSFPSEGMPYRTKLFLWGQFGSTTSEEPRPCFACSDWRKSACGVCHFQPKVAWCHLDLGPALAFLDVCYCLVPSSSWSKAEIVCQALPGQQHCYFLNKDAPLPDGRSLQGTLISKIAFQHPGRVPLILNLIRHQVAYNTLIGSCVKRTVLKEGGYCIKWNITHG